MKKWIALLLTALLAVPAMPVWAATESYVSREEMVQPETEFTTADAPILILRASEDHTGVFTFMLTLSKAQWTYGNAGMLQTGVTYTKISDTMMTITVDTDTANATQERIQIPLLAKLTQTGVATVTIDPMDSTVTAATYAFARSGEVSERMSIAVEGVTYVTDSGTLQTVSIRDPNTMPWVEGEVLKLKLTNGFIFKSAGSLYATGKFQGVVAAVISSGNSSVLELKMTGDTTAATGMLVLSGLKIAATEDSVYGSVGLVLDTGDGVGSINVGNHVKQVDSTTETPEKDLTAVRFYIGRNSYTEGTVTRVIPTIPYLDENGRTMLPLRAIANALGVADEEIHWSPSAHTVSLKRGDNTVEIGIGGNLMTVNGNSITMDTQAVIRDDYTYLPMRAVLNGLGITDDNIVWDETAQTVTFYK